MADLPDEVLRACAVAVDWAVNESSEQGSDAMVAARATIRTLEAHGYDVSRWEPIETAPEYETVLTQHKDDLHPTAAFKVDAPGGPYWGRAIEGPEDDMFDEGNAAPLYREPTHWRPLPPPPRDE